ncbi:MAG: anhydro-N-acetylmuramic acid kinase [Saprospiraceae bacterium]
MKIVGLMSGSSLDGVDIALCRFDGLGDNIEWEILKAKTYQYPVEWKKRLEKIHSCTVEEFSIIDYHIGYLYGDMVKEFLDGEKVDYIASHGHTVFHFPDKSVTCQIGNGAAIAVKSGISTICDFRSSDVGLGGQGAPLASLIDRQLFSEYGALVNLGGISNISFNMPKGTIGYDISPCNQLLNHIVSEIGMDYDIDGIMASKGKVDKDLLNSLLDFDYFSDTYPKSLDNSFIKASFFPILDNSKLSIEDKLSTSVELIAQTLSIELKRNLKNDLISNKVLITGGGANNIFLIEKIKQYNENNVIIVPDRMIVDYKESLLMAYMGYLRIIEKPNVLSSTTGAKRDSISGAVYII